MTSRSFGKSRVIPIITIAFIASFAFLALLVEGQSIRGLLSSLYSLETPLSTGISIRGNGNNVSENALLPDWRMTTDCSAYGRDCVLRKLNDQSYAGYPFSNINTQHDEHYKWQDALPYGWNKSIEKTESVVNETVKELSDSIVECVASAQAKTIDEQLTHLLPLLKPNKETNMVAFTISDYLYAKDMIQDVFEMAHNIVGFKDAFFVVAMDVPTMELACKFGYPFLAWPQEQQEDDKAEADADTATATSNEKAVLKANVANSKFDISYLLTQRRQSFFFFEMDVWFVASPIPVLREQTDDILFSGHQNSPAAANIGVYSVLANEASEEYMRIVREILQQAPDTHDQVVMQKVQEFLEALAAERPLQYDENRFEKPFPKVPTFQNPAKIGMFLPFQIIADERPVPSETAFAIHTLVGSPLQNPHGKKMLAKELGAWCGSGSYYYDKSNRFLWLDGHTWSGYSFAMSWLGSGPYAVYHNIDFFTWTIAATLALARRTNRIWVMPKLLNDAGIHFLWTLLDISSVEALGIDYRETNFPVNHKAWHSASEPFAPVARTAVGGKHGTILAQLDASDTSNQNVMAWNSTTYLNGGGRMLDAWFAIHSTIPELDDAQVVLAGLPAMNMEFQYLTDKVVHLKELDKLSPTEREVADIWKQLKWCKMEGFFTHDLGRITGRTGADWDCYLKGVPALEEREARTAS